MTLLKPKNKSQCCITLNDIVVKVRVGLGPEEYKAPQRLVVSLRLYTDADYLSDIDEQKIIDYDHYYQHIRSWEQRPHTKLIETFLNELIILGFEDKRINAVYARIAKPDIFDQARAAAVETQIPREQFDTLKLSLATQPTIN